jgi:hypothetical protein
MLGTGGFCRATEPSGGPPHDLGAEPLGCCAPERDRSRSCGVVLGSATAFDPRGSGQMEQKRARGAPVEADLAAHGALLQRLRRVLKESHLYNAEQVSWRLPPAARVSSCEKITIVFHPLLCGAPPDLTGAEGDNVIRGAGHCLWPRRHARASAAFDCV